MGYDVPISAGVESSGIKTGFAEIQNEATKLRANIQREFSTAINFVGAGGIIAGLQAVINKGEEIHHLSERFGLDAEKFQPLGNVAKENGSSMESLTRSMNKAIIA